MCQCRGRHLNYSVKSSSVVYPCFAFLAALWFAQMCNKYERCYYRQSDLEARNEL